MSNADNSAAQPMLEKNGDEVEGGGKKVCCKGFEDKCQAGIEKAREKYPKASKCFCCCSGRCCKILWFGFLILFVLTWTLQALTYYYATLGCGPRALEKYTYPIGQKGPMGTGKTNLVPMISLLTQKNKHWGRDGFDDIPSNAASNAHASPVGTWFRYWGPVFYTMVYMDSVNSMPLMYMRRNLLRIGIAYQIVRCDQGTGGYSSNSTGILCKPQPGANIDGEKVDVCKDGREHFYDKVEITEGAYWMSNKWREMWGMQQGSSFNVYVDGEKKAVAQRVMHDVRSFTFRDPNKSGNQREYASGLLKGRHWHGEAKDEWLVQNQHNSPLPYYIINAATTYLAFQIADQRAYMTKKANSHTTPKPSSLFLEDLEAQPVVPSKMAAEVPALAAPDSQQSSLNIAETERLHQHEKKEHWMKAGEKYEKFGVKYEKKYATEGQPAEHYEKQDANEGQGTARYEKQYTAQKMQQKYAPQNMEKQYGPHVV